MAFGADYFIDQLQLQPHPEGGWFRETYRAEESITRNALPARFDAGRNFSTAIYFLLTSASFSAFHRIKSDEMWHFYDGDMLEVFVIDDQGTLQVIRLGRDINNGQVFQAVVKKGQWFASRCSVNNGFSLVGCTVSPGFDFKDFEMADRIKLSEEYPNHKGLISELTR